MHLPHNYQRPQSPPLIGVTSQHGYITGQSTGKLDKYEVVGCGIGGCLSARWSKVGILVAPAAFLCEVGVVGRWMDDVETAAGGWSFPPTQGHM